jgi:mannose/fructose/N-acetylgalactosamine-specific phosphotransferase system component IID
MPVSTTYQTIMGCLAFALTLGLALFATQSVWQKRNYLIWALGLLVFSIIVYLLPDLENKLIKFAIVIGVLAWLIATFLVDFISFKLNKKNAGKRFWHNKDHYLIFVWKNGSYNKNLNRVSNNLDKTLSGIAVLLVMLLFYLLLALTRCFL